MKNKIIWLIAAIGLLIVISGCNTSTAVPERDMEPGEPAHTATAKPPTATETPVPTDTPEPASEEVTATPVPASPTPTATIVYADSARYRLTFDATWSAETHPMDFPRNAHWSGLIGVVHTADAVVWMEGSLASPGIKAMAETGAKRPLDNEVNALIDAGNACEAISGDGIAVSPGSVSVEFNATQDCSLLSVVTMIAPSPDWFVGLSSLPLFGSDGWVDVLDIELLPWDAGTDSGESYASANAATNPPQPVALAESESLLNGADLQPLGVFRIELITE